MASRKLPKAPKKPKASASLNTWLRFEERVKDWKKRCSDIEKAKNKKKADKARRNAIVRKYANGVK